MPTAWKIIFAFLREMILGKLTFQQAFKQNKVRLGFFLLVVLSFYLNYLTLPKFYAIAANKVEIELSYKEQLNAMEARLRSCSSGATGPELQDDANILEWCLSELDKQKRKNKELEGLLKR